MWHTRVNIFDELKLKHLKKCRAGDADIKNSLAEMCEK